MNEKTERSILNKLIKDDRFFNVCIGQLQAKFFKGSRVDVFKLIKFNKEKYEKVNFDELEVTTNNIQNIERRKSIIEEIEKIKETNTFENFDLAKDETLKFIKNSIFTEALETGADGIYNKDDSLISKSQQLIEDYNKVHFDDSLGLEFLDIQDAIDYYTNEVKGILTHHFSINNRIGSGFLPGTLSLILAASGVGKSLMMTDFISGMIKKKLNVLLVSLELSSHEVLKRVHSNVLNMPISSFNPKDFNVEEFKSKIKDLKVGKFYSVDYPAKSFSPRQLETLVDNFKQQKEVEFDVIFVDYMGIMKSDLVQPNVGLYSYIKSIAEELRASAVRLNVPIISASQLNREATNNLAVDNNAVSDSYGTTATADFMMFLLQNEDLRNRGEMICKITKNRFSGNLDTFKMLVDRRFMRFECSSEDFKVNDFDMDFANNEIKETTLNDVSLANKFSSLDDF